ncbi:50S ribosomal protein L18 [Adhaeribacter pallidiroseus]|uniref:Large ribosomal subunit protein uL18 n=1 Tax=Adhaeribacter pallidiroseus TaxID=2072847 RepID=A0A369QNA9_9BACT|nr:50S ribosomal protein L18 [Adhaeribacter pallidiroseus]RDC64747.1 50S ribosomal protein L18 [Adhaeribacter pallidiroseus]
MSIQKSERRLRIRRSIRTKISGTANKPRLSVFRSNKAIYAQLINDLEGRTLISVSSSSLESSNGSKVEVSSQVGKTLASKAQEIGITEIVFDRSGYLYHGRVKSLAEGAREGGLKF